MTLLERPAYLPFMEPRTAKAPGLSPLCPEMWTVRDADYAAQMAYRAELLRERRPIVIDEVPECAAPAQDLLTELLGHIATCPGFHVGDRHVQRPDGVAVELNPHDPFGTIGNLVCEDFCLLDRPEGTDEYRLVGAVLVFPSRWSLAEKLGHPLTIIHDPVPDYDETLARRVNRVFDTLRPGRGLVRINWLVHATSELHLPLGLELKKSGWSEPSDTLFLRTERQTLVRLPRTGSVAFGIKTSVSPLASLVPSEARALEAALGHHTDRSVDYHGGPALYDAARRLLAKIT